MKKLLSLLISIALAASLVSCGGDPNNTDDGTDGAGNGTGTDSAQQADVDELLALYRNNDGYDGVLYSSEFNIYNMSTEFSIHSSSSTYTKDRTGNIYIENLTDTAAIIDCEYLIGDEYYVGDHSQTVAEKREGIRISISDDEKKALTEHLSFKYGFGDPTVNFIDVKAVDNENETYMLLCHTEDSAVIDKFEDTIKSDLSTVFDEGSDFSIESVDYQIVIDKDGNTLAFVIAAAFELLSDEPAQEGSLENYYSYILVTAVSEYTETLTAGAIDLSDVTVTEKTYTEHFGE